MKIPRTTNRKPPPKLMTGRSTIYKTIPYHSLLPCRKDSQLFPSASLSLCLAISIIRRYIYFDELFRQWPPGARHLSIDSTLPGLVSSRGSQSLPRLTRKIHTYSTSWTRYAFRFAPKCGMTTDTLDCPPIMQHPIPLPSRVRLKICLGYGAPVVPGRISNRALESRLKLSRFTD